MEIHAEYFWSRQSAEQAGKRLAGKGYAYSVSYARRADLSHDWLLRVFA